MVQLHGIHSRVLADMQIDTTTPIAKKVIFPSHYRANEYVIKVVHITGIPQEDLAIERNGVKRTPLHWVITFECKRIRPADHSALPTKTIPSHSRRRCQSKRERTTTRPAKLGQMSHRSRGYGSRQVTWQCVCPAEFQISTRFKRLRRVHSGQPNSLPQPTTTLRSYTLLTHSKYQLWYAYTQCSKIWTLNWRNSQSGKGKA